MEKGGVFTSLRAFCEFAPGSPSMPRASPVSVYLFPGEAPKSGPSVLQVEDSELDRLVATATEAQADMVSDEGSEGSTDNDDFCILEAPGMGIPVRPSCSFYDLISFSFISFTFPDIVTPFQK